MVNAIRLVVVVLSREWPLGPRFAQDMILLRSKPFLPLGFGQVELIHLYRFSIAPIRAIADLGE
jgi:hypothetical protein